MLREAGEFESKDTSRDREALGDPDGEERSGRMIEAES